MRKLRWRYILTLYFIIMISTLLSIVFSAFLRIFLFPGTKMLDALLFGFALKDLLLPISLVTCTVAFIGVVSKKAVNPIVIISNATKEIASGNFDVRIDETDRTDEIGDLQRNFNRMARELKSNEYLKKDFISNVSHEFKTPLSIIQGYAKLLEKDGISAAEKTEYAKLIASESEKLSNLTTNILRLSKLDNQEICAVPAIFLLDEQIRQAVLLLEPKWSRKQIKFNIGLPQVYFTGDEDLLSQVWANLIENAIKFTPDNGSVSIAMQTQKNCIQVEISDNGVGMDEETRRRIFEKFYQGDSSHAKEGNGLGLSIVKRIIEMHGGKANVESAPNKGTKFTVWLPTRNESAKPEKKN